MKPVIPTRKNRKEKYDQGEEKKSRSAQNSHGSILSGPSRHPFNKSASHGSICDNGSDIYVTSAAYKTTSEIRFYINARYNYINYNEYQNRDNYAMDNIILCH